MSEEKSRRMFERAVMVVLRHEGGYVDDPLDRGGETNFGISSRSNPDIDISSLTRAQAVEIYWERYWRGLHYEELPPQVATKTFDLAVNMGRRKAVACLQRALRACGLRVRVDGILGPETWGAVWKTDGASLLPALRSEAAGEYRLIAARDSSQIRFVRGWLDRAYS